MNASDQLEPAGSLRSLAISEIRGRIQRRELQPDETFSEVAMCEKLGMSRASIREALIVLATGGWVEALPRAGWQVKAMTLNEMRDLLTVRATLAPVAAAAAARRAPHEEEAVAALCECSVDGADQPVEDQVVATYRCFRRISRLSGNLEFDRCLEDVLARLVRYHLLAPVMEAIVATPVSLQPIADAVLDGRPDAARSATAAFVAADQARITEAIINSDLIRAVKIAAPGPLQPGSGGRRSVGRG